MADGNSAGRAQHNVGGPAMTEPGPLSDELAKFLGAAQELLHRSVIDPSTAGLATGSAECCWCPLCQLISTIRGDRPELVERWGEVQTAIANLLRTAAQTSTPASPRAQPRVQRIDLSDPGASTPSSSEHAKEA